MRYSAALAGGPIPKTLSGKIRHAVAKEMFGKVSSQ